MNPIRRTGRALGLVASLATAAALTATGPTAHAEPDALPTLLLPNMVVPEGNAGVGRFVVNVGLSAPNPLDRPVSVEVVDFSAVPVPGGGGATYGTATPGQDYVAFAPFRLTFQPGQQVARFTVKVKGDHHPESGEEIDVRFDDTELTVGDNDIDLVLADDDATPPTTRRPRLLLPNQVMPEPDSGCFAYRVSVLLDKPAPARRTVDAVDFTTVPLPAPATGTYGTATPGSDYVGFPTRTLSFGPGSRSTRLPVTICGDTDPEAEEEIDVRFDNAPRLAVGDNDIDLVLSNDD
ncbi:MAG: Calx-beta domain-containing protein [Nocardioidaceae bacterium]